MQKKNKLTISLGASNTMIARFESAAKICLNGETYS